jgi:DNA-directed RNA polymerase specialized sigma24 family protein
MTASTEDIWTAFRHRLRGYIRARSHTPEDADDILQDVFVKVHRHLGTLEDDAHNTIIDHYGKEHPPPTREEPPTAVEDERVTVPLGPHRRQSPNGSVAFRPPSSLIPPSH